MSVIKKSRKVKGGGKTAHVFEAQVYVRGNRVVTKTFDTRSAAEVWHDETKRQHLDGTFKRKQSIDITFGECFAKYLDQRFPELLEQTRQTQSNRHQYLIESPLVGIRMEDLSAKDINEWFSWLKAHKTAQNKGRKTFRQEFNLLRSVLNWYRDEIDEKFVVPIVKRHRKKIYYKSVPARRPDYFIPAADAQKWVLWLQEHRRNKVYFHLACFLLLTASRIGEAAGLYWDAVNLDEKYITVVRTVWWDYRSKRPNLREAAKNDASVGIINLPDSLVEMLRELKKSADLSKPVFAAKSGELIRYNAVQSAFNAGFRALGLSWRSTHICRHTHATHALVASGSLSAVQASIRHASIRETERYAKVIAMRDRSVAQKTANILNLLFTEKITVPVSEAENS